MEKLFVLRNVLSHGTTLIQHKEQVPEALKNENPYSWQSKLHGVARYLEKQFGRGGVFENLAHPECPEHFMTVTQQYFTFIEQKYAPLPERAAKTVEMIKKYNFGYFNWHR